MLVHMPPMLRRHPFDLLATGDHHRLCHIHFGFSHGIFELPSSRIILVDLIVVALACSLNPTDLLAELGKTGSIRCNAIW